MFFGAIVFFGLFVSSRSVRYPLLFFSVSAGNRGLLHHFAFEAVAWTFQLLSHALLVNFPLRRSKTS